MHRHFSTSIFVLTAVLAMFTACSPSSDSAQGKAGESPLNVILGWNSETWSYDKLAALPNETFVFNDGSYFEDRTVKAVRVADLKLDPEGTADVMTATV